MAQSLRQLQMVAAQLPLLQLRQKHAAQLPQLQQLQVQLLSLRVQLEHSTSQCRCPTAGSRSLGWPGAGCGQGWP